MNADEYTHSIPLHRFGLIEYLTAFDWQRSRAESVREGRSSECLALLEHPPVYTMGARGGRKNLLAPSELLEARGARVVDVDRGGDITFHGPGQLIAYPILNIRKRRIPPTDYVRSLESTLITTLDSFGIDGRRVRGKPGIWVGGAKIAAVGVRIQRGVTSHGIALNVSTDLSWFEAIVPCGLPDAPVVSMGSLTGVTPAMREVEDAFTAAFSEHFQVDLVEAAHNAESLIQAGVGNGR
ncbi:MAG: lipoyl(octanoyl) transferase LipB [Chloroflexi bacterium]|nr:lipoyl(octanoyl) transferase LipB [Chloroflexota bacterium]MCY3936780.1 lipoyl(octanoyl) transferase LipB [Chloroflexota bacterium]